VPRHFDTVCDGTQAAASRGLVARNSYRVPAHRALTSTEIVADATVTLDNNARPLTGDVNRALNIGIEAGSDPVHAPSTLALVGLMQAAVNAQGRLATAAPVATVPSQTDEIPPPVVASASAEATARIVQLESELALAHKLSADRLVVLWLMIVLLFIAIIALVWQHTDQKRKTLVPSVPRVLVPDPKIRQEWERKIATAESERDSAKSALERERGEALQFRTMSEVWATMPKLKLPFSVENLDRVLMGWLRLPEVEQDVERLNTELAEARAKPSSDGTLLARLDTEVRDGLTAVWRGEFGKILTFSQEEHRRIVDEVKVRDLFSQRGTVTVGRSTRRKEVTYHDLRGAPLTAFLSTVHDGLGHALDIIDRMLGHRPEEASSDEESAAEQPLAEERTRFVANPLLKARDDEQTTRVVTRPAAGSGEPADD
jgi:hypothetical protein